MFLSQSVPKIRPNSVDRTASHLEPSIDPIVILQATLMEANPCSVKKQINSMIQNIVTQSLSQNQRLDAFSEIMWCIVEAPITCPATMIQESFYYILQAMQRDCALSQISDIPSRTFTTTVTLGTKLTAHLSYDLTLGEMLIIQDRTEIIRQLCNIGWSFAGSEYQESPSFFSEPTTIRSLHVFTPSSIMDFKFYGLRLGLQPVTQPGAREFAQRVMSALVLVDHPLNLCEGPDNTFFLSPRIKKPAIKRWRDY